MSAPLLLLRISLPSYYLPPSLFLRKGKGGLIPSPLGEG